MVQFPKVREVLEFILKYRGTTVFCGMTEAEIVDELVKKSANNELAFHIEPEKGITGLMILEVDHENKIVFVLRNLNITPAAVIAMCCLFEEHFKGYRLQGEKRKWQEYKDPMKLVKRWASMAARKLQSN